MRDNVSLGFAVAIALVFTVGAAAQSGSPPVPSTSPDRLTAITVTGCVRRNEAGANSPVGTSGGGSTVTNFLLADARPTRDPNATPDETMIGATATVFRLYGNDMDLAAHVGRRVEIAGTVDLGDDGIDHGVVKTAGTAPTPKLAVTTVKEIAGTCTN